jgi:hypothetical protein
MKKLSTIVKTGLIALFATPVVVSAEFTETTSFLNTFLDLLDIIVLIILALALVFFLWGVAKFILNAGDPEEQTKGKSIMFWGLIALFVMVSVWGLVNFIQNELGIENEQLDRPDIFRDDS